MKSAKKDSIKFLTQSAIVAALYAALTMLLAPISFGPMQVRVAEALGMLPIYMPAAVPGLFVGCAVANLLGGNGILDVVAGSLTTLVCAFLAMKIKNRWLAPIPAVALNAVVVAYIQVTVLAGTPEAAPFYLIAIQVAVGQAIAFYALGVPLTYLIDKNPSLIGKSRR